MWPSLDECTWWRLSCRTLFAENSCSLIILSSLQIQNFTNNECNNLLNTVWYYSLYFCENHPIRILQDNVFLLQSSFNEYNFIWLHFKTFTIIIFKSGKKFASLFILYQMRSGSATSASVSLSLITWKIKRVNNIFCQRAGLCNEAENYNKWNQSFANEHKHIYKLELWIFWWLAWDQTYFPK